jgi:hypothetical protein
MNRRELFPLMAFFSAAAGAVEAPKLLRLEPAPLLKKPDVPSLTYRNHGVWTDGGGNVMNVPLSAEHIDKNFWVLHQRVEALEKALGLG